MVDKVPADINVINFPRLCSLLFSLEAFESSEETVIHITIDTKAKTVVIPVLIIITSLFVFFPSLTHSSYKKNHNWGFFKNQENLTITFYLELKTNNEVSIF
jgi:hypothetical protein